MTGHSGAVRSGRLPEAAEAAALLATLPAFTGPHRHLEPLAGGLTNRNYRVTTATGNEVVARFSDRKSSLLAIDRAAEAANSRIAASVGVAPRVVAAAPERGVLVVEWIDGRALTDAELDDPDALSSVATLCRELHAGPRFVSDFDMFDVQRGYLRIVRDRGFRLPVDYLDFEPDVRRLEQVLRGSSAGAVPCHNDLLAANIVTDGARLWFIDFEYSGNNDACFELGNIWSEADLGVDRLEHLVGAYFGGASTVQTARARLFGTVAKYGWMLWASIQDAVSDVQFDFWDWGMAKYERARAEFRSPAFEDLISTIRD